ncbi:MAG: hypothetical protein ACYT04_50465 [Nostoc sp.]
MPTARGAIASRAPEVHRLQRTQEYLSLRNAMPAPGGAIASLSSLRHF